MRGKHTEQTQTNAEHADFIYFSRCASILSGRQYRRNQTSEVMRWKNI